MTDVAVRAQPAEARDPERAQHLSMLEFGSRNEFADPSLGYRRLFGEMLGTFMLVLVAAGGGLLHAKGQISLSAAVVAPGLMVMAIILFMGAVSGAHLNPVVSLAFALRGDFPWKRVPGYIVVQLVGATLACLFLLAVFGDVQHLGATLPGPGYGVAGVPAGDRADRDAGQRDPGHGVGGSERRHDRRPRGRRLHRARRPVGGAGQRHLDEPGPLVRPGARRRRLDRVLGVRRGPAGRGGDRRRLRDDTARAGGRPTARAAASGSLRWSAQAPRATAEHRAPTRARDTRPNGGSRAPTRLR